MIRLQNLTKSYRTPVGRHFVFRDLDVTLPEGKSVGLIGRNGAGKSTLLRVVGGIDKPDSGRVVSAKSISWPVALGSGFQYSLTGRENVKFVCRLYADKADIPGKIAFVQKFAEVGEYFDMPVKTYSSGMRSRLAFGLSMAFDFDYYLMDEVTAVGDPRFQRKCAELIRQKREKANFLMASHNLANIKKHCDVALVFGRGGVSLYDDINEAIEVYQSDETAYTPAEPAHA